MLKKIQKAVYEIWPIGSFEFDMKTGGIVSLFDKRTKKEFVREGGQLNTLRISLESS